MTLEDVRALILPLLEASRNRVRAYAIEHAPLVPTNVVESIVAAIGTISEGEAVAVLDRIQLTGE